MPRDRKDIPKQKLYSKCSNCGSTEDLVIHHIIPVTLGGTSDISNLVCLCGVCHDKAHGIPERDSNHSFLVKKSLAEIKTGERELVDVYVSLLDIYTQIDKKNNESKCGLDMEDIFDILESLDIKKSVYKKANKNST